MTASSTTGRATGIRGRARPIHPPFARFQWATSRRISAGMRSTTLVGMVVALALAAASVARAQPTDVVQTFQAGVDAFRLGKYAEARELLEKARALGPEAAGAAPVPRRGRPGRAAAGTTASRRRARRSRSSPTRPRSRRPARSTTPAARARAAPSFTGSYGDGGAIAVTANVEGATVTLGGLRYGATPLAPRQLAVGPVEVPSRRPAGSRPEVETEVLPQLVTDVVVTLEPDPNAKIDTNPNQVDPTTHGWLLLAGDAEGGRRQREDRRRGRRDRGPDRARRRRPRGAGRGAGARAVAPPRPHHARPAHQYRGRAADLRRPRRAAGGRRCTCSPARARSRWRDGRRDGVEPRRRGGARHLAGRDHAAGVGAAVPDRGDRAGAHPRRSRRRARAARRRGRTSRSRRTGVALVGAGVRRVPPPARSPGQVDGQPAPFAIAPILGPDGDIGAQVSLSGALPW